MHASGLIRMRKLQIRSEAGKGANITVRKVVERVCIYVALAHSGWMLQVCIARTMSPYIVPNFHRSTQQLSVSFSLYIHGGELGCLYIIYIPIFFFGERANVRASSHALLSLEPMKRHASSSSKSDGYHRWIICGSRRQG